MHFIPFQSLQNFCDGAATGNWPVLPVGLCLNWGNLIPSNWSWWIVTFIDLPWWKWPSSWRLEASPYLFFKEKLVLLFGPWTLALDFFFASKSCRSSPLPHFYGRQPINHGRFELSDGWFSFLKPLLRNEATCCDAEYPISIKANLHDFVMYSCNVGDEQSWHIPAF